MSLSIEGIGYHLGRSNDEWPEVRLAEISAFITKGSTPTTYGFKWEQSGVVFLRSECVSENGLDLGQSMYISDPAHKLLGRSAIRPRDLLITITGNVGRVVKVPSFISEANINQHIARIRIVDPMVEPEWVFYYLQQPKIRIAFERITTGQAYPQISLVQVRDARVPIPPIPEQRAIAEALGDVDELIGSLERLIAKKRETKQAVMQQLLTGKTRLPGFTGDWRATTLKSVADIATGINKPLSEMGAGALYVTVQDLYQGNSIPISSLGRIRVSESEIQTASLMTGDIVFGKSSVKRNGIGYPSIFLGCDEPVVCSGFTYRARAIQGVSDPSFLFYALRAEATRRWLIDNSQASALTNINKSIADAIPISLPSSVLEQAAIADVLTAMDSEIDVLLTRLAKTTDIKQGMMQQLLTGKVRFV